MVLQAHYTVDQMPWYASFEPTPDSLQTPLSLRGDGGLCTSAHSLLLRPLAFTSRSARMNGSKAISFTFHPNLIALGGSSKKVVGSPIPDSTLRGSYVTTSHTVSRMTYWRPNQRRLATTNVVLSACVRLHENALQRMFFCQ